MFFSNYVQLPGHRVDWDWVVGGGVKGRGGGGRGDHDDAPWNLSG